MAGKTINKARNAQHAMAGKSPHGGCTTNSPQTSTSSTPAPVPASTTPAANTIILNGISYAPVSQTHSTNMQASANIALAHVEDVDPSTDFTDIALSEGDLFEYNAFMALTGVSTTSIDWSKHTWEHVLKNTDVSPMAYQASRPFMANLVEFPFIFDSSANCHILPKRADFKDLKPIPPIPVKGFGGSSVQAMGMGAIDVIIASGLCLSLTNVLFVPNADICLLSVSTLNRENGYTCYGFWTCTIRCYDMGPGRAFGYFPTLSKEPSHVTCFLTCYYTLSGSHDPTVM